MFCICIKIDEVSRDYFVKKIGQIGLVEEIVDLGFKYLDLCLVILLDFLWLWVGQLMIEVICLR